MQFGYYAKTDNYFSGGHPVVASLLAECCDSRILDVGCGHGGLGRLLKSRGERVFVAGVERHPPAAEKAASVLDRVWADDFETWDPPGDLDHSFDYVVFADVLEHLIDPRAALLKASRLLRPAGHVIASIPNVRWLPVVWDLCARGNWAYQAAGVLDATHLRFFTKRSIWTLFEDCGFQIERYVPVFRNSWPRAIRAPFGLLARFFTTFEQFYSIQYVVAARLSRPRPGGAEPT